MKLLSIVIRTLFLSAIILVSCVQSARQDTSNMTSRNITEEIIQVQQDMWKAIEEKDIKAYARFIHPDFTQFGEMDPMLQRGKAAEVLSVKEWLEAASDVHTIMEDPQVTVRGEVAWMTYYWRDRGYVGGQEFASYGKSTRIYVRENGTWLCIHGHYTLIDENKDSDG